MQKFRLMTFSVHLRKERGEEVCVCVGGGGVEGKKH